MADQITENKSLLLLKFYPIDFFLFNWMHFIKTAIIDKKKVLIKC